MADAAENNPVEPEIAPQPAIIAYDDFFNLINKRSAKLMTLARYLDACKLPSKILVRPLIAEVNSQAAQIEELLDAYGARNNCQYYVFRHLVSSIRLFSTLCYKLLHLRHSTSIYRLLPIEGDLKKDTDKTLLLAGNIVVLVATRLIREAKNLQLSKPQNILPGKDFEDGFSGGILEHNRKARKVVSAKSAVVNLATAFLVLAAESDILHIGIKVDSSQYGAFLPDPISEETLGQLVQKFHNMQSLYDTHLSDTNTEKIDPALTILRGHISVIFHLLETAICIAHYYERHIKMSSEATEIIWRPLFNTHSLLDALMGYSLTYASRYLESARSLCQNMLKRYAELESMKIPVPRYRGFHVRPSTLLAKIVKHYGSEVELSLNRHKYDAGSPLDLFRVNEEINRAKRKEIAKEVELLQIDAKSLSAENMIVAVKDIIDKLAEQEKVIIYEHPLPLDALQPSVGESLNEYAAEEIARLLALNAIDIVADLKVLITGDKRVLEDIKLLAENGYGEDPYGNNIELPKKLSYLRH